MNFTLSFRSISICCKCYPCVSLKIFVKIEITCNMVSDSIDLPFFPKYEIEYVYEDKIRITWFESHFSQSHYNVHNTSKGSNACTLIAVLMASKCNQYKVVVSPILYTFARWNTSDYFPQINGPKKCLNIRLIQLLACSMLEGNRIHEELKLKNVLKHINLNVPEAMKFAGKQTSTMAEWVNDNSNYYTNNKIIFSWNWFFKAKRVF